MKNSVNRRKRNSDQKILLKRERRPVSLSGRERLLTLRPLSLLKVQAVLTRTVVVWSFELVEKFLVVLLVRGVLGMVVVPSLGPTTGIMFHED